MDELLVILADISRKLLPILGCVALIFLFVLLRKMITFVNNLNTSVLKVNNTIDTVDRSLQQLQVPLNTAVTISHTIDTVHDYGKKAFKELIDFIVENIAKIKAWLEEILRKDNKDEVSIVINKEEDTDVQ